MSLTADSLIDHTRRVDIVRSVSEFFVDVSRDVLPGKESVHKFGRNTVVGTSTETIWSGGGIYTFPTAAETVRVKAGGNVNDTAAGSGARTIIVVGLDQDWLEATEEITLAGASASAATTTTFIRIFRAYCCNTGTYGGANTGNITIENTSSAQVLAVIEAGLGQTTTTVYSVASNKRAYLLEYAIHVEDNKPCDVIMYRRENADNTTTPVSKRLVTSIGKFIGRYIRRMNAFPSFPPKTDIWFDATANSVDADVAVNYDLLIIDIA